MAISEIVTHDRSMPAFPGARSSARPGERETSGVVIETVRCSTELDSIIFASDTSYDLPLHQQRGLRQKFLGEAFVSHVERSETYRRFVERRRKKRARQMGAMVLDEVNVHAIGLGDARLAEAGAEPGDIDRVPDPRG